MVQDSKPFPLRSFEKKKPQHWRWLVAPMLLLSAGLHGLLLFAPLTPSEEELVPPPDPEEDGIAITKIDPPKPRPATPPPTGTQKTAPPTQNATGRSPQNTQARSGNPTQTSPSTSRTSSTRTGRGNSTPSRSSRQNSSTPSVPNLPSSQRAQNPNPTAPNVNPANQGRTQAPPSRTDPFEEYIAVFETFRGVQAIAEAEAAELQGAWLRSFQDQGTAYDAVEIEVLRNFDQLPYNANLCLPATPASAQILVMVEADGALDEDRQFVQRTGYRAFDQAAMKLVETYSDFPEADTPKAYLAEVQVDYDPENCEWPPKVDQLPDEYFTLLKSYVGPELTTFTEANAAQAAWVQALKDSETIDLPNEATFEPTVFEGFEPTVEYPLAICLPIEPREARWGVVVNPDGSLQGEPQLLRSTGYKAFNDRSQTLINEFDFPTSDRLQAYVVEVGVDYNKVNCQSLDSEEFRTSATPASAASPTNGAATPSSPAPAVAFAPATQAQLIEAGRQATLRDPMGALNNDPGLLTAILAESWPEGIDRSCFLSNLDAEAGPVPVEKASDALALSENFEFVPTTLSRLYGVEVFDAATYCNAPLYEMKVNGVSQLFASAVGFGAGSANALVVIWPTDPR